MTPAHKHPSGPCEKSNNPSFQGTGTPEKFAVKVDDSAPVITCGFKAVSNKNNRLEDEKTLIVSDTLFFYDIEVSIQTLS
jgi:hypothetical protein